MRKNSEEDTIASLFVNSIYGILQVEGSVTKARWYEYFSSLLNKENPFIAELPATIQNDEAQPDISIHELMK